MPSGGEGGPQVASGVVVRGSAVLVADGGIRAVQQQVIGDGPLERPLDVHEMQGRIAAGCDGVWGILVFVDTQQDFDRVPVAVNTGQHERVQPLGRVVVRLVEH